MKQQGWSLAAEVQGWSLMTGQPECRPKTRSQLCVVFLRNRVLLVLLYNAVARGLIQPLCGPDSNESALPGEKDKKRSEKMEKSASVHGSFLDPAALQDVHKALEVCQCVYRTCE